VSPVRLRPQTPPLLGTYPLLVRHDDADREFDYIAGAEKALDEAKAKGWTVVSIRNDWTTVFGD
jgi:hypothetical protein